MFWVVVLCLVGFGDMAPPLYSEPLCEHPRVQCDCVRDLADCIKQGGKPWPWWSCSGQGALCCSGHDRQWWGETACYWILEPVSPSGRSAAW